MAPHELSDRDAARTAHRSPGPQALAAVEVGGPPPYPLLHAVDAAPRPVDGDRLSRQEAAVEEARQLHCALAAIVEPSVGAASGRNHFETAHPCHAMHAAPH
eukprot:COSAG01_NODE_223_length_21401_cov_17.490423_5_plen_102_part_00